MQGNTIRSVGVFLVVGLLLGGLVFGGITLAKNRESHFATQKNGTTNEQVSKDEGSGQREEQPKPTSIASDAAKPDTKPSAPDTTPAPPAEAALPQPAAQAPTQNPSPATTPEKVPSTGPDETAFVTIGLVGVAVYLMVRLRSIQQSYWR